MGNVTLHGGGGPQKANGGRSLYLTSCIKILRKQNPEHAKSGKQNESKVAKKQNHGISKKTK